MKLTFGEMLHIHMRRAKARIADIAQQVGVSRQMLVYYVAGYSLPREESKVKDLAKAIKITDADTEELLEAYRKCKKNKMVPFELPKKKIWDLCVEKENRIEQLEREIQILKERERHV